MAPIRFTRIVDNRSANFQTMTPGREDFRRDTYTAFATPEDRFAYLCEFDLKLTNIAAKIARITRDIDGAIGGGSIEDSRQLRYAVRAATLNLASARTTFEQIRGTDAGTAELREKLDRIWDDLSQSIVRLLAQIPRPLD